MLALTERNVKSDRIHVRSFGFEEQTARTLMFNMTGLLRFGSQEVRPIKLRSVYALKTTGSESWIRAESTTTDFILSRNAGNVRCPEESL